MLWVISKCDEDVIMEIGFVEEVEMKGTPTQKQGNIARPVKTPGGLRPDKSGDGASVTPSKKK